MCGCVCCVDDDNGTNVIIMGFFCNGLQFYMQSVG